MLFVVKFCEILIGREWSFVSIVATWSQREEEEVGFQGYFGALKRITQTTLHACYFILILH